MKQKNKKFWSEWHQASSKFSLLVIPYNSLILMLYCHSKTFEHPPFSFHRPSLFYLLTVGVEVVYFHLITLTHTPQSVGLLWPRDRPVAETSTWQHKHSQQTNIHAPGGIRTHDPSKHLAADLQLRPRGHWDRPHFHLWRCNQKFLNSLLGRTVANNTAFPPDAVVTLPSESV
jgi:hypothetical protein